MKRSVEMFLLAVVLAACSGGGKTTAKPVATTPAPTTSTAPSYSRATSLPVARTTTTRATTTTTTKPPEGGPSTSTSGPFVAILHRPPEAAMACVHHPTGYVAGFDYGPHLPILNGTSLSYSPPWTTSSAAPQPDGKGNTIGIGPGFSVVVTTPRGTVTFAPGASGDGDVGLKGWGDFLGNGHTDLLLETYGGRYQYQTFIVQADGRPGTYDPALVGVHVPNPTARRGSRLLYDPEVVGDQNADGTPDIAFGPYVYESRQLATLPPGAKLPAPIFTIPSRYVPLLYPGNLLNIDPNAPPSLFALDPKTPSVRVFDARADELVLTHVRSNPAAVRPGEMTGWLVNGHHIVQYEIVNEEAFWLWRWDLDARCAK